MDKKLEENLSWYELRRISVVSRWHSDIDSERYYVQIEYNELPTISVMFSKYQDAMNYADMLGNIAYRNSGF